MKQKIIFFILLPLAFVLLSACSRTAGQINRPGTQTTGLVPVDGNIFQSGIASWYGQKFHGKRTANGEIYDMHKLTAAHQELPFHSLVEVENIENGSRVIVRINDRGPFLKNRIIDLSYKAAQRIGMVAGGTAPVRLRLIKKGTGGGGDTGTVSATRTGTETETGAGSAEQLPGDENSLEACYLQAGAFSSLRNAERMVKQLKKHIPAVAFKVIYQDGFYKVVSEGFYPAAQAEAYRSFMAEKGIEIFVKK